MRDYLPEVKRRLSQIRCLFPKGKWQMKIEQQWEGDEAIHYQTLNVYGRLRQAILKVPKFIIDKVHVLYNTVYMQPLVTTKELEAIRKIRNSVMHVGRVPSMRELMSSLGYRSPRSASLMVDKLIKKGVLRRKEDGGLQFIRNLAEDTTRAQTVDVPLVGVVSCGAPILAEENIQAKISVSTKLARPPHRYFLLKAKGDSMDQKGINSGDLVLVRLQTTAKNGDMVVALIDDEATIKEFHVAGETVLLKPKSRNKEHKPIVLTKDFEVQGVVVTSIPNI